MDSFHRQRTKLAQEGRLNGHSTIRALSLLPIADHLWQQASDKRNKILSSDNPSLVLRSGEVRIHLQRDTGNGLLLFSWTREQEQQLTARGIQVTLTVINRHGEVRHITPTENNPENGFALQAGERLAIIQTRVQQTTGQPPRVDCNVREYSIDWSNDRDRRYTWKQAIHILGQTILDPHSAEKLQQLDEQTPIERERIYQIRAISSCIPHVSLLASMVEAVRATQHNYNLANPDQVTIGNGKDANIHLASDQIAQQQAVIEYDTTTSCYTIEALPAQNSTKVSLDTGMLRVLSSHEKVPLVPGQTVAFGSTPFLWNEIPPLEASFQKSGHAIELQEAVHPLDSAPYRIFPVYGFMRSQTSLLVSAIRNDAFFGHRKAFVLNIGDGRLEEELGILFVDENDTLTLMLSPGTSPFDPSNWQRTATQQFYTTLQPRNNFTIHTRFNRITIYYNPIGEGTLEIDSAPREGLFQR